MKRGKTKREKKKDTWPVKVFILTFVLAMIFSFLTETTLFGVSIFVAVFVLIIVILIGIVFDMLGVSVAFQNVAVFTAMASKKIAGAKQCIKLIQNAERVSNICNDVIGDICGIISGAMGAAIAARVLIGAESSEELWIGIILSSLIAAMTVGGKAIGKRIAMRNSQKIVWLAGKFINLFSKK